MRFLLILSLLALGATAPAADPVTPGSIVKAATERSWKDIDPADLLVIDLKNGRRVVIQLAPRFAPVHVANIRTLARGHWWDGSAVYRVQDGYVVQWGRNESKDPLPAGVVTKPPAEYWRSGKGMKIHRLGYVDDYAPVAGFASGWPIAYRPKSDTVNLVHCYGYVGVARDLAPDTGTGAELYTVIGHAPRQLDRNITIVGRIIEGMDAFSSLPRGTGDLGFYADRSQDVPIAAAHLASDLPKEGRPSFQYMDTDSAAFAAYIRSKANRHDAFYERPAGGVDLCNVTVPLRPTPSR